MLRRAQPSRTDFRSSKSKFEYKKAQLFSEVGFFELLQLGPSKGTEESQRLSRRPSRARGSHHPLGLVTTSGYGFRRRLGQSVELVA